MLSFLNIKRRFVPLSSWKETKQDLLLDEIELYEDDNLAKAYLCTIHPFTKEETKPLPFGSATTKSNIWWAARIGLFFLPYTNRQNESLMSLYQFKIKDAAFREDAILLETRLMRRLALLAIPVFQAAAIFIISPLTGRQEEKFNIFEDEESEINKT